VPFGAKEQAQYDCGVAQRESPLSQSPSRQLAPKTSISRTKTKPACACKAGNGTMPGAACSIKGCKTATLP